MSITLQELAGRIGAVLDGDGTIEVAGCAPLPVAARDQISFLANPAYTRFLASTSAAAVIVDETTKCPSNLNRLVAADPYYAFCRALVELYGHARHPRPMDAPPDGPAGAAVISPAASVHERAAVGAGTHVHPHATVEAEAVVGERCVLYPGSFVGPGARLGDDCVLYPNAVVYTGCVVGDRVTLHANTVVGQDGFGYATHGGVHHKIPQTGIVVIEDDVEMGAGCAVERAALGETRVGKGTKFADLISIGHGTTIGEHCLFVSLVGVSGSVEVGNYVVLGGQVGVTGHLRIGHGVQAAGKTAIVHDVPDGTKVAGIPAVELGTAKRNYLAFTELYEMSRRLRKLERQLERLSAEATAR